MVSIYQQMISHSKSRHRTRPQHLLHFPLKMESHEPKKYPLKPLQTRFSRLSGTFYATPSSRVASTARMSESVRAYPVAHPSRPTALLIPLFPVPKLAPSLRVTRYIPSGRHVEIVCRKFCIRIQHSNIASSRVGCHRSVSSWIGSGHRLALCVFDCYRT